MTAILHGELSDDASTLILAVTGDDWEMEEIAQTLTHLTPKISKSKPPGALLLPASWPAVVQLAFTFTGNGSGGIWSPSPRLAAWMREQAIWRTTEPGPPPGGLVPEDVAGLVRDYQWQGAGMIARAGKFLLLDEPGTGKTLTTIAGLRWREALGVPIFPAVIAVPSWSVADAWQQEIARWAPGWPEPVLYGGTGRGEKLSGPGACSLFLTTYATACRDAADMTGPLVKLGAVTAIADEFHFLKNQHTKRSHAFRRLAANAQTTGGLSGTPITRDAGDLWPILFALEPGAWPSRERYVRRFCRTGRTDYGEMIEGLNRLAEPEFRMILTGSMRRIAKADVLTQLPPKIYSVRRVELPPEWRKAYDSIEEDMLAELPGSDEELEVVSTLTQFRRLAQLACSAADVTTEITVDEDGTERKHWNVMLRAPSWKSDELLEILAERPGQPVVAFAPSKQLIRIAGQAAEKAGYRVGYLTGGMTNKARTAAISTFQDGRLDLLAATSGAGGTGITLTRAGTVVYLQRPWFEESQQSEDRAHRLGSEEFHDRIQIIDIVAKDTVDTRIRQLLKAHARQLSEFLDDMRIVRELLGGKA